MFALCVGLLCGVRIFMPLWIISLASSASWLPEWRGWLAVWNWQALPWLLLVGAVVEAGLDKAHPTRRYGALLIAGRICSGAVAGTTVGALAGTPQVGLAAGITGTGLGILLSRVARRQMAVLAGSDVPGSLAEDGIVLLSAFVIVAALA